MADVNANIGIHIDTSQSLAEIKALQRQLAQLYTSINKGSAAAAMAQKGLATNLMNTVNAGGKFYAQMGTIRTSTESFTHALEKNKLTMREYFRFAGGSTKTFGKLFKSEFDTIGRVAEERVKKMQTQYIKLGRDASGAMKAISITPTTLNMKDYGNQVAVAAQKQALLNQLLKQGSTNLLNFGKNTQWAGRQLMVGFTIPLAYFGTTAAKTFMDLEAQALKFKRVYGDMFTTTAETQKALSDIENLAKEFTKYGVAVSKTMEMAASAAAMGKTGAELTAQVAQATRLAVLGNVEQEQALQTTISLTNAFGLAAEDLTSKINFLNAVENQTVTAIEDLTIAIPKAGPVVESLGGSVEDLAFFLTAMREGGINASEGANALKSGLASLINPTGKAAAMLSDMGVNINAIVEQNFGNLRETVIDFAQALDTLAPLERSRAIEQLFGKFQFARLDALFTNVTKEGGQAARVLDLAGKSVEELAILSERELKAVEDAVGTNFRAAVEELKLAIAPIGKEFLKAITPVVKFFGDLLEKFNNLSDGSKKFIVILTTLIGLVGPTLLMTFGLLANGVANIIKMFLLMRQGFLKLTGDSTNLAQQTQYLNSEQMEAAVVAASLNQAHTKLTQQFILEAGAVGQLRNAYVSATAAATRFAAANPGMMVPGAGRVPKKFAKGTTFVPGSGSGDTVPSLLTPGEAVIPAGIAQDDRFKPLIEALVSGEVKKFAEGTVNVGGRTYTARSQDTALNLQKKIADLISKGMSEEKIIKALDKNIERGRPMTASALERRLSTNRGAGARTSAPSSIRSLAKRSESGFMNEKRAIKEVLKRQGIAITPAQEKNLFTVQASHIEETKNAGVKQWNAGNLVADLGYVNNYLNTVKGKLGQNLLAMSDDQLKSLGIDRNELKALQSGRHPTTAKAAETLRAVARYDTGINPRSYQAKAVLAGLEYRSKTNFYGQPMKTLADMPKAKTAESSKVTSKTGAKAPAGVRAGGKPSDTRMVLKSPGELTVTKKSADALRSGRPVSIPGFGRLRLAGFAEGDPSGQRPLSQAQIRAAQEGTSLKEAKRRVAAEQKAIIAAEKQAAVSEETTKQTKNFGAKLATGANVFSGLTIAGSMMGGKIGEVSQKLAPLAIGASTIGMLLPGLKSGLLKFGTFLAANPFVAVGLAIAGIAVAAKIVDEKMKKQARAQSDYIDTISATTEKMKRVGEITGEVGASQIMQKRREGTTADKFVTGYDRAGQQFGTSFLESEVGKEILGNFQNNLAKGGSNAVKQVALELSSYVSDGLMKAEDANSVARSIGINMSDMALAANIQGEIRSIIGPDGQDLVTDPLKVRLQIVEESRENIQDYATALSKELSKIGAGGEAYDVGFARDMAAAGAASSVQALEAIQAQRDAQAKLVDDKIRDLELEKSKTKDKERQAQIEQEISSLKNQQTQDDKTLAGQRSKIIKDQLALFKESQKVAKGETAFFEAAKQQVKTKFEGDAFTEKFIEVAAGLGSKELEVQLLTVVGAGDLSPRTAINFIELFKGNEAQLDAVINSKVALENPDKFAQLQNIAGGLQGKGSKKVGLDIVTALTSEGEEGKFDDRLAALTLLQKMDGKEINLSAFLKGDAKGKLDELVPLLNKVEGKKTISIEVLQELAGETGVDMSGLISDWDHYVNLPDDVKKTVTQTYIAIYKSIGDKEASEFIASQVEAAGGSQLPGNIQDVIRSKYMNSDGTYNLPAITAELTKPQFAAGKAPGKIPGGKTPGDGNEKQRDTTLDNLLNRLKFIRKASIDAEKGVGELLKITSGKGLTNFGGVMQQLMSGPKGGANREFISFLEGMDNKTRAIYMNVKNNEVALTKQGKALKEAFNEKVIGEYQVSQYQAIQDAKAQESAFVKLKSAGVDTAQALEMVSDANLAVAINAKSISSKELAKMAADAKKAADAQDLFNLKLEASKSAENLKTLEKTARVLSELSKIPGISKEALSRVAQSPMLMDRLYKQIFENAKKGAEDINTLLDNAAKERTANFRVQVNVDPSAAIQGALDAALGPAMSSAQAMVAAQTRVVSAPFLKRIADAQRQKAALLGSADTLKLKKDISDQERRIALQQGSVNRLNTQVSAIDQQISDVQNQMQEIMQNATKDIDERIDKANQEVDNLKRAVELEFDKPIQDLQRQIDAIEKSVQYTFTNRIDDLNETLNDLQRQIEIQFGRPIEILQRESTGLSRELQDIDDLADKINEKYDLQQQELQKVADLNEKIANSQKQQLDLADAITKGDASAAARAMQEMRAQAAKDAAESQGELLNAARNAEVRNLRSKTGRTRKQIEERQKQIDSEIRSIEAAQERFEQEKNILGIKDQIYDLEEQREASLLRIRDIQKNIDDLEAKRLPRLIEIEDKERAILKLEADRELAIAAAQKSLAGLEKQIRDLEGRKSSLAKDIVSAQKALSELETDKTYLANQAKIDELNDVIAGIEADIAAAQAEMEAALANDKTLQTLIGTLEDAETAIANAYKTAFEKTNTFATDLETIANAAKIAAEAVAELFAPGSTTGAGTSTGTGVKIDSDDAHKGIMARAGAEGRGDSSGAKTASGIKTIADALTKAKDPAKAVSDSLKLIKDYVGKFEPQLKSVTEYISSQAEKMPTIKDAFAAISEIIKNINIKPYSDGIAAANNNAISNETIWGRIKTAISNAISSLDSFIAKLISAFQQTQNLVNSLNTTVVTTHIIRTVYETEGTAPNTAGTNATGKMYGGKIKGFMGGGLIPYMANGGFRPMGSDTVPAMLTPGEFVVNRASTQAFMPLLSAINDSKFPSSMAGKMFDSPDYNIVAPSSASFVQPTYNINSSSNVMTPVSSSVAVSDNSSTVYNYSVGISVGGTNADPKNIAKAVINEIKYIDSQKIRTQRA